MTDELEWIPPKERALALLDALDKEPLFERRMRLTEHTIREVMHLSDLNGLHEGQRIHRDAMARARCSKTFKERRELKRDMHDRWCRRD